MHVPKTIPQERALQQTVEQSVEVPVPMQEEIVPVPGTIPQERIIGLGLNRSWRSQSLLSRCPARLLPSPGPARARPGPGLGLGPSLARAWPKARAQAALLD